VKPRKPLTWPATMGPNTPLARREFIARGFRDLALSLARQLGDDAVRQVQAMETLCGTLGEHWLTPIPDTGAEWITLADFAALAGRNIKTVYAWYGAFPPSWAAPPERVEGHVRRVEAVNFLAARDTAQQLPDAA